MDYKEIEIEGMKEILRDKEEEIKKLNERIRFLEQCLDNKEKVNKSLREENRNLKEELEWYRGFDNYLTNHGFDMKKLKSELFKKNQN